jgi:hypothetical protein
VNQTLRLENLVVVEETLRIKNPPRRLACYWPGSTPPMAEVVMFVTWN